MLIVEWQRRSNLHVKNFAQNTKMMTVPGITEDEIDQKYLELLDLVDEMKRYQNQGFRALSRVLFVHGRDSWSLRKQNIYWDLPISLVFNLTKI
jgi:hypothetical protein